MIEIKVPENSIESERKNGWHFDSMFLQRVSDERKKMGAGSSTTHEIDDILKAAETVSLQWFNDPDYD